MENKAYHMLVFTTKKTLHERFTPKNDRCVFILNNGDSSASKNGDTRNILMSNEMETDEICITDDTYNQTNIDENEEKAVVPTNIPARRIQNNLFPANLRSRYRSQANTNLINLTGSNGMGNRRFPIHRRYLPLRPRSRCFRSGFPYRGARKDYRTNKSFRVYSDRCKQANLPNFSASRKYHYIRPFSYRWGRRRTLITKEQLDDEIDKYMADVLFSSSYINVDKGDANENYLNETEKFLKSCEISD